MVSDQSGCTCMHSPHMSVSISVTCMDELVNTVPSNSKARPKKVEGAQRFPGAVSFPFTFVPLLLWSVSL